MNAHGRLDARLKSSVTIPSASGASIESTLAPGYVVTPLVASVNSKRNPLEVSPKAISAEVVPASSKSMTPTARR